MGNGYLRVIWGVVLGKTDLYLAFCLPPPSTSEYKGRSIPILFLVNIYCCSSRSYNHLIKPKFYNPWNTLILFDINLVCKLD